MDSRMKSQDIPDVEKICLTPVSNWREAKTCPVCHIDYVHIMANAVTQNTITTVVDGAGFHIIHHDACYRGSVTHTVFRCENDHTFRESQAFHKGQTFVDVKVFYTTTQLSELWRV